MSCGSLTMPPLALFYKSGCGKGGTWKVSHPPCFVLSWLICKPFPAIHDAPCWSSFWLRHINVSLDSSMKTVAVFTSLWWYQTYLWSYLWRRLWIQKRVVVSMKRVADSHRRLGVKRISGLIYEESGGIHIVVVVSNISWKVCHHHVLYHLDWSPNPSQPFTMHLVQVPPGCITSTYLWTYLWRWLRYSHRHGGVKCISGLIYEEGCGLQIHRRCGGVERISGLIYHEEGCGLRIHIVVVVSNIFLILSSLRWCRTYLWSYLWRRMWIQKRDAESHHCGGVKCIYYYFLYSVDCIYSTFAILIVFYFLSRKQNLMTMSLGSVPT